MRFFSFLGGILLGSMVAGVMGLLFAPRAGEDTRRYLMERGEEIKERATGMTEQVTERAQDASQKVRSQAREYRSQPPRVQSEGTQHTEIS